METPFVFGKLAEDFDFTDREPETARLIQNFTARNNTILISPRRWGKSSLVQRAVQRAGRKNDTFRFVTIDLFNVRTEEEFYRLLAQEVLRASASKFEGWMENARLFLGRLMPKLSYSPTPDSEFSLGLDWEEVKREPDDVLNLAEKINAKSKTTFVICIDEFQNVATFDGPLAFQKKLRANWQKHRNAVYCLYGSKRHMMLDVFTSPSMPFYKFGDMMMLEKISTEDWIEFIVKRFADTGKSISKDAAALVATKADNHPYYVQQLAQQVWLRTGKKSSETVVKEAHESLVLQLSLLFQSLTDGLSASQVNFLKALTDGVARLSAADTLRDYKLGSSANVTRVRQALVEKEIIDVQGDRIEFMDPMYAHWLRVHYFRKTPTQR